MQARAALLDWLAGSQDAARRERARTARRLWRSHGLEPLVEAPRHAPPSISAAGSACPVCPSSSRRHTLSIVQLRKSSLSPVLASSSSSLTVLARPIKPQPLAARVPLVPFGRSAAGPSGAPGKRASSAAVRLASDTSDDDLDLLPSRAKRRRTDPVAGRVDTIVRPVAMRV